MDTRRKLRAWELVQKNGIKYLGQWEDLKFLLAPFFAQNAKQQTRFYEIFDAFQEECAKLELPQKTPPWYKQPWFGFDWREVVASTLGIIAILGILWYAVVFTGGPKYLAVDYAVDHGALVPVGQTLNAQNQTLNEDKRVELWGMSLIDLPAGDFSWELKDDETGEILAIDSSFHFAYSIPESDYGKALKLTLTGETAYVKYLFWGLTALPFEPRQKAYNFRITCANPPIIQRENVSPNPAQTLAKDSLIRFQFNQELQAGEEVKWYIEGEMLTGKEVSHTFKTGQDQTEVRLELQTDTYCRSIQSFTYNLTDNRIIIPLMPLQEDQPDQTHVYSWLYWLLSLLPIIPGLWLLWRWRKELQPEGSSKEGDEGAEHQIDIPDVGPYTIPWASRDHWIDVPIDFYRMADILRRREEDLRREFDGEKTVKSTIESGGFPVWEDKPMMRSAEYLVLIQQRNAFNQQDRLFARLADFFKQQETPVTIFFHKGQFEGFWQEGNSQTFRLEELSRRYGRHRLIILGDAHGLVNPHATLAPALIQQHLIELLQWERRIIFTPESTSDWSVQEALLHPHFLLYPASTAAMREGLGVMDRMEEYHAGTYALHERNMQRKYPQPKARYREWDTVEDIQAYLEEKDLIRWIAALAVHQAPDWALTIATGRALGIAVTHDDLLQLSRIPWFAENTLDNDLRLDFLRLLSDEDTHLAREAALAELEDEEVIKHIQGSFAELNWKVSKAVQEFALAPRLTLSRENIRPFFEQGLLSIEQEEELSFIIEEKADRTGLSASATESIENWLDEPEPEAPKPWLTWKLLSGAFLTLLGLGMWVNGLLLQMVPGEGKRDSMVYASQTRIDSALIYYNRAIQLIRDHNNLSSFNEWDESYDSVTFSSLRWLGRASEFMKLRGSPLSDSTLVTILFNQYAKAFNFYQLDSIGIIVSAVTYEDSVPIDTSSFPLFGTNGFYSIEDDWLFRILPPSNDSRYLAIKHLQGLYEFHLYGDFNHLLHLISMAAKGTGQTSYNNLDSAKGIYDNIIQYSRGQYFDSIESELPVNLETLLDGLEEESQEPAIYLNVRLLDRVSLEPLQEVNITLPQGNIFKTNEKGELSVTYGTDVSSQLFGARIPLIAEMEGYNKLEQEISLRIGKNSFQTLFMEPVVNVGLMVIRLVDQDDTTQALPFSIILNKAGTGRQVLTSDENNEYRVLSTESIDQIEFLPDEDNYIMDIVYPASGERGFYPWKGLKEYFSKTRRDNVLTIKVKKSLHFEIAINDSATGEFVDDSPTIYYAQGDEILTEIEWELIDNGEYAFGVVPYSVGKGDPKFLVRTEKFGEADFVVEDFQWGGYPDNTLKRTFSLSANTPAIRFINWLNTTVLDSYLSFGKVETKFNGDRQLTLIAGNGTFPPEDKTPFASILQFLTDRNSALAMELFSQYISSYGYSREEGTVQIINGAGEILLSLYDDTRGGVQIENLGIQDPASTTPNRPVLTKLKDIIVEKLGVREDEVTDEASIENELGADELDFVEIIMEVEKEYNISISDDLALGIKTVGDLTRVVENLKKDQPLPLPKMLLIQGGTFQMGSEEGEDNEKLVHQVTLSDFYLAETEVTFEQYDYFCEQTRREKPNDIGWGRGNRPVINVSWEDATAYCQWASEQTGLNYRLPTEAEWEYAAGGGASNRMKYAGTDVDSLLDKYAVFDTAQTSIAKSLQPNSLKLYDMSGNAYEWCSDWYGTYPSTPQSNPAGPQSGDYRVVRGGSWYNGPQGCRVANRDVSTPASRGSNVGFRLSRSL